MDYEWEQLKIYLLLHLLLIADCVRLGLRGKLCMQLGVVCSNLKCWVRAGEPCSFVCSWDE